MSRYLKATTLVLLIILISSCGRKAPLLAPEEIKRGKVFKNYSKTILKSFSSSVT
ncbi:MAG: hypothetical protein N2999_00660 [Proteobacteria bacterium]|nr:hypothetical protein [Pseudomonadota bacterium]